MKEIFTTHIRGLGILMWHTSVIDGRTDKDVDAVLGNIHMT